MRVAVADVEAAGPIIKSPVLVSPENLNGGLGVFFRSPPLGAMNVASKTTDDGLQSIGFSRIRSVQDLLFVAANLNLGGRDFDDGGRICIRMPGNGGPGSRLYIFVNFREHGNEMFVDEVNGTMEIIQGLDVLVLIPTTEAPNVIDVADVQTFAVDVDLGPEFLAGFGGDDDFVFLQAEVPVIGLGVIDLGDVLFNEALQEFSDDFNGKRNASCHGRSPFGLC